MAVRLAVISFTKQGSRLAGRLVRRFLEEGEDCRGYAKPRFLNDVQEEPGLIPMTKSLEEWTGEHFAKEDGLIFIGAAGIAVRAVAPFLKDKLTDPAVVVVDEDGRYAVSLLSGHVGGANALARRTADILGAEPVITTASDVRGMTGIDVWAADRGLTLSDRELAKSVAAAVLDGEPVGFYSDFPVEGDFPDGTGRGEICRLDVWITAFTKPQTDHMISLFLAEDSKILRLIPQVLYVGVGCRKGTPAEKIRKQTAGVLERAHLDLRAVAALSSIDLKKNEAGMLETAGAMQVPFLTYPAETLEQTAGDFTASAFVKEVTGTDNVCERAALAAAGPGGRLLVRKQAADGVTVAVAVRPAVIGRI